MTPSRNGKGVDLSVPVLFDGTQPALFGLPPTSRTWARSDDGPFHVARGASCNVETLTITPHVHGTHTECVGHITEARISLVDVWRPNWIRALLVTVRIDAPNDLSRAAVSAAELQAAVEAATRTGLHPNTYVPGALVLRTRPSCEHVTPARDPARVPDAVRHLSIEAAAWVRASGFRHLLIDAPSIDPMDDGGLLAAHRAFWGLAPGSVVPDAVTPGPNPLEMTITELICVPDLLKDGLGWLDIHIPQFDSDAAPSRPLFYPDASAVSK